MYDMDWFFLFRNLHEGRVVACADCPVLYRVRSLLLFPFYFITFLHVTKFFTSLCKDNFTFYHSPDKIIFYNTVLGNVSMNFRLISRNLSSFSLIKERETLLLTWEG